MKSFIISLALLSKCVFSQAQVLTASTNQLRQGDKLSKEQTAYLPMDDDAVYWNLKGIEVKNENYRVGYKSFSNSTDTIVGTENRTRYYYRQDSNSLLLVGYENNMTKVEYDTPEMLLHFPMSVGAKIVQFYHGIGSHCGQMVRLFGRTDVSADTVGTLILPNGDSLQNVLRVYSDRIAGEIPYPYLHTWEEMRHYTDSIRFTSDSISRHLALDSTTVEIVSYRWYAPGYRYPIFETISAIPYKRFDKAPLEQKAYFFSPEDQDRLIIDPDNEKVRKEQAGAEVAKGVRQEGGPEGFSYTVRNNHDEKRITITYDLQESATVRVLLCDNMGVVYKSAEQTCVEGVGYNLSVNYGGLHTGQYVLYIKVNWQSYVHKLKV